MKTTANTTCKYSVGEYVEVLTTDFDTPGWPKIWVRCVVENVKPVSEKCFDVVVRHPNNRPQAITVGIRGGNRSIRHSI